MKKKVWIYLGIISCLLLNSCNAPKPSSVVIPICNNAITIDGTANEWKQKIFVSQLVAPWQNMEKDQTEIYLCHDKKNLYFLFKVKDSKLVYGTEEGETSVNYSDRVELFICKNDKMETYYCAEVDPNGKVLDYTAHFHRKFDFEWDFDQLQTATSMQEDGYIVEGTLPLDWLQKNNILSSNGDFYLGLFRANASDPTKEETIVWLTWNIPDAKEPDFHIPSSLRKVQLQDYKQ